MYLISAWWKSCNVHARCLFIIISIGFLDISAKLNIQAFVKATQNIHIMHIHNMQAHNYLCYPPKYWESLGVHRKSICFWLLCPCKMFSDGFNCTENDSMVGAEALSRQEVSQRICPSSLYVVSGWYINDIWSPFSEFGFAESSSCSIWILSHGNIRRFWARTKGFSTLAVPKSNIGITFPKPPGRIIMSSTLW